MTSEKTTSETETLIERMNNVLVPVDFSRSTEVALRTAAAIARAFGSHVRLLHVAPPNPRFAHARSWPQEVRDELAKDLKTEHVELRALSEQLEREGIQARALLARGAIDETIVTIADGTETDLILLTSKREGALSQLLPQSGVIRGVLRKTPCKVLVVPVD